MPSPSTTTPSPKIAILGAGLSGLLLARLLQLASIPVTIYEAEASRHVRNQGGTLDLHPQMGQLALREAGLWNEFVQYSKPEADVTKIVRFDGTVLWDENLQGTGGRKEEWRDRPEIDREDLRGILLQSVGEGSVRWGCRVKSVEAEDGGTGKHSIRFADGTVERGLDLVVGADGAWSKVRPLLTSEKPFYSGITGLELWSLDVETRNPELAKWVGQGSCFMFDEGRALLCQRNGNGSVRTYACVRQPEDWLETSGLNLADADGARETMIEDYFVHCGEDIKRAILSSRDELIARKMWMLPVGMRWESRSGLTLIGDAAHLMTPFAGVGVNLALKDALDLAVAIMGERDARMADDVGASGGLASGIERYEQAMFERSEVFAKKTMGGLRGHFSRDGAEQKAAGLQGDLKRRQERSDT